eukprot:365233-Chlamydomonas_euryale.AAC.14
MQVRDTVNSNLHVSACVCACVHACMRACKCGTRWTPTCMRLSACMRACVHACMHAVVQVRDALDSNLPACMRACVHACGRAGAGRAGLQYACACLPACVRSCRCGTRWTPTCICLPACLRACVCAFVQVRDALGSNLHVSGAFGERPLREWADDVGADVSWALGCSDDSNDATRGGRPKRRTRSGGKVGAEAGTADAAGMLRQVPHGYEPGMLQVRAHAAVQPPRWYNPNPGRGRSW